MKQSILELLEERPLRVLTPEEPAGPAKPEVGLRPQREAAEAGTHTSVRPLLISFLLVLLTYWVLVEFLQ